MSNDNKLTIALVVVVGLLAVVAIVISAVSLSKNMPPTVTVNNPSPSGGAPSGGQGQGQGQGGQQPIIVQVPAPGGGMGGNVQSKYQPAMGPNGRIYSWFLGHDYGSHSYFDGSGYLSGFGVGFIDLVCEAAEIDCRLVWDRYTNCWDSAVAQHAVGGQGLHGGWYDGCLSYYTTVERSHVFQFSQAYLKEPKTHFFILPSKSFDTNKENILRNKIVFLDGWASDEKCMARETGAIMFPPDVIYAKTTTEAIELLNTGGYAALFTTHATLRAELKDGVLKIAGPEYSCMLAGNAMMARKDSDSIVQWNRGFMKVKNNGRFKKYCAEQNAEHIAQGTLECVDSF